MSDAIEGAIDNVRERQASEQATVELALVEVPILTQAINFEVRNNARLKPRPSERPHLLIWVPETNGYQALFLPPGTLWHLMSDEQVQAQLQPQRPRLYVPGQA